MSLKIKNLNVRLSTLCPWHLKKRQASQKQIFIEKVNKNEWNKKYIKFQAGFKNMWIKKTKHLDTTVKHHRPREILKPPGRKNRLPTKECQLDWQHSFLKQPEYN